MTPGRRTGIQQNHVRAFRQRGAQGRGNGFGFVGHDGTDNGLAARLLNHGGKYKGVEFRQHAPGQQVLVPGFFQRHNFRTAGNDEHTRPGKDRHFRHAASRQRPQLIGADGRPLRHDDFRSDDILAHLADVLPRKGGFFDDDKTPLVLHVDMLHHNHRIAAFRQRMPRIDPEGLPAHFQTQGRTRRRGKGGVRPHGNTVHGRAVKGRRRTARRHRRGQHTPKGTAQRHLLHRQGMLPGTQTFKPEVPRLFGRR